jgi:hypothetical protein
VPQTGCLEGRNLEENGRFPIESGVENMPFFCTFFKNIVFLLAYRNGFSSNFRFFSIKNKILQEFQSSRPTRSQKGDYQSKKDKKLTKNSKNVSIRVKRSYRDNQSCPSSYKIISLSALCKIFFAATTLNDLQMFSCKWGFHDRRNYFFDGRLNFFYFQEIKKQKYKPSL